MFWIYGSECVCGVNGGGSLEYVFGEGMYGAGGNVHGVHCVESILARKEMWGKEMREMWLRGIWIVSSRCRKKAPLIVRVEEVVQWQHLWGELQKYRCAEGQKVLSRLLGHHGKGKKPCPCCDNNYDGSAGACIVSWGGIGLTASLTNFVKFRSSFNIVLYVYSCYWYSCSLNLNLGRLYKTSQSC
jgi:hypothetical protein